MDGLIISTLLSKKLNNKNEYIREPLWVYAAGSSDAKGYFDGSNPDDARLEKCGCPCTNINSLGIKGAVTFSSDHPLSSVLNPVVAPNVGQPGIYYCGTGFHSTTVPDTTVGVSGWLGNDPLWDRTNAIGEPSGFDSCLAVERPFLCFLSISSSASPSPTPTPTATKSPTPTPSTTPSPLDQPPPAPAGGKNSTLDGGVAVVGQGGVKDDGEGSQHVRTAQSSHDSAWNETRIAAVAGGAAVGVAVVAVGVALHRRRASMRRARVATVAHRLRTQTSGVDMTRGDQMFFDRGIVVRTDALEPQQ